MKKIYLIILIILVSAASRLTAQENLTSLQYSIGYSTGDLNDFIGKTSFRGLSVDFRNMIANNIGVGFEIGFNHFYEVKDYDTYTEGTMSLSGKQYRYCLTVPVLVSADYFFNPGELINPFIGFGIGMEYSRNDLKMGLYSITRDPIHFAIKPEIGVIISPGSDVGIIIAGKFYDVSKSGEIGKRSYFTTNIGLVWER